MKKKIEGCDLWEFVGNKKGYFGITDIESFTDILKNRIKTFNSWFNVCRNTYYKDICQNISTKDFDLKIDTMVQTKRFSTYCIELKYDEYYHPVCNIKINSLNHFFVEVTKVYDYIDDFNTISYKNFYTKSNLKDHDVSIICTKNYMPLKYDLYNTSNCFEKFVYRLYINGLINRFYLLGGNKMSKMNSQINNKLFEKKLDIFSKTTIENVMKRYNMIIDNQTSSDISTITIPEIVLKEFSKDSINDRFFTKILHSLEFQNNNGTIEASTYVIDGSETYHSAKMFSFKFCENSDLIKDIMVYNDKILKSIYISYILNNLNSLVITTSTDKDFEGISFYDLVLIFIMNYILNSWNKDYFDSDRKEEKKSEKDEISSEQKSSFIKNRNLLRNFIENSIPGTIKELKKNKIYQLFMSSDISSKDVEDLKNILIKLIKEAGPILPVIESLVGSNNKCKKDNW